jgi:hypothetical protein
MKEHLASWCLALLTFFSLAGCGAYSGDRLAWEVLVDISRPEANVAALDSETPVAWRLWSTQGEIYPKEQLPDVLIPDSKGHYGRFRGLPCELDSQSLLFGPSLAEEATGAKPPCKAVFLNDPAAKYILDKGIFLRQTLADAAAERPGIHLPSQGFVAREIKTAWWPIGPRDFGDYIVAIDKDKHAWGLVALHLMTHERPKWLWATWIHQKYANLVPADLGLHDSFGTGAGRISDALRGLLESKNELFLANYKLIGSQADFKPGRLGNPLIEGNLRCSSCMGCHQSAGLRKDGRWSAPDQCETMGETPPLPGINSTDFDYSLASQAECHNVGTCKNANLLMDHR